MSGSSTEAAAWLEAIAAGVDELVFVTELGGRMLWANDALARHTGYTVADFQFRQPDNPFLHPDDAPRVGAFIAAFASGDAPRSGPIENRFFDRWGHVHAYRSELWRVTAEGAPALLFVCTRLAIEEPGGTAGAEASYRALIDQALDPIVKVDATGRLLYASARLHELLGVAPSELAGKRLADLTPEPEAANTRLLAGGRFALTLRAKDGSLRACEVSAGPVGDGGLIAIVRDVTEARAREDELRQAQKVEAIGRLAGGVAHDFNNMLGVILAHATLLERGPGGAGGAGADHVAEIRQAAERAARLTHQLLAFSRRQVLRPTHVDVGAVVRDMGSMLQTLIGEAVTLRVDAAGTRAVLVDRGQLEQVILNLTVNARDAMPRGGALVITVDEQDGRVRLAVSDEGVGMPSADVPHVFEPFFTTKATGTGLGLATVHGIVRQSHGEVRVHSQLDRGTTIEVLLPIADGPVDAAPPSTPARPVTGGARVLLVEDEALLRRALTHTLEIAGYEVVATDGPTAALAAAAASDHLELLLTDFAMPGMNGRELCRRILALHPRCRAVVMSGYASHDGAGDELGVTFLAKPFTLDAMLAVLEAERAAATRS